MAGIAGCFKPRSKPCWLYIIFTPAWYIYILHSWVYIHLKQSIFSKHIKIGIIRYYEYFEKFVSRWCKWNINHGTVFELFTVKTHLLTCLNLFPLSLYMLLRTQRLKRREKAKLHLSLWQWDFPVINCNYQTSDYYLASLLHIHTHTHTYTHTHTHTYIYVYIYIYIYRRNILSVIQERRTKND